MRFSDDKAKKVTLFQHFIINEFSMRPRFRFSYVSVFCIALFSAAGCGQDGGEDAEYYFALDDHMVRSNVLLRKSNQCGIKLLSYYAYGGNYYTYALKYAEEADQIAVHFNGYIEFQRAGLLKASGGLYPVNFSDKSLAGRPVKFNDTEIAYTYFTKGNEPKGAELYKELAETRLKLNNLIDSLFRIPSEFVLIKQEEIDQLKKDLLLNDNQSFFAIHANEKGWNQMFNTTVAKTFPLLSMLQNEVIHSEACILNFLNGKLSGHDIYWGDPPVPVSIPEKSFVYLNEKFSTEICFFYEGNYPANLERISVDGISLPIVEGRAHYETIAKRKGENSYKVEIWVKDFADKTSKKYSKIFKYEVGTRCD